MRTGAGIILCKWEKIVLSLIGDEFTNREMAEKLDVSTNTVDTCRKSMLAKPQARNTTDLVRLIFWHKLVEIK